jgi:hypothetical protein
VPLAGKYCIVDIALRNCINSDIRKVIVLTQFNSASLNQHIAQTYRFDHFRENARHDIPNIGIGDHTKIANAIIDRNARIGNHVTINNSNNRTDFDGENFYVRDAIVVIPQDAILPDGPSFEDRDRGIQSDRWLHPPVQPGFILQYSDESAIKGRMIFVYHRGGFFGNRALSYRRSGTIKKQRPA